MRRLSLLGIIYLAVGVYIAWANDYITVRFLKNLLSVILAIGLWFLILLDVDLRIN